MTTRRTVDNDLDNFGKYFYFNDFCTVDDDLGKHFFHDFYVAQLQYNVPTGDLCTIDFTCRYLHSTTTWSATSEGIARRNYENEKNARKQEC